MLVMCPEMKPPNCEIANIGAKFEDFYRIRNLNSLKEEA